MSIHQKILQAHQRNNQQQQQNLTESNTQEISTQKSSPFSHNDNQQQQDNRQNYYAQANIYNQQINDLQKNNLSNQYEQEQIQQISQMAESFNSSKYFVRFTTQRFPKMQKSFKDSNFKFSAIISPYGTEENFPVAVMKNKFIVRCEQCRAYMNPFCEFISQGYKYKCNLCRSVENIPNHYYCALDDSGKRQDLYQKPELSQGSFDIIAGADYASRAPMPPTYFFLIDVSKASVESGMLQIITNTIKESIQNDMLQGEDRKQFGIITYDSKIHIYNLKSTLNQPQMYVISDMQDIEIPIPENLVVTLSDSKELILNLLESIPNMFLNTQNNESCFTFALDTVLKVFKHIGGRLFIFQNSPKILMEPVFAAKPQNDNSNSNINNQQQYMIAGSSHLRNISSEMHINNINTSIFIFSDGYKNAVTLGELAKYLNGDIFYYNDQQTRQQQLQFDLKQCLEKQITWESVFRIRCTKGYRISQIYGNFSIKSTDLLSYPCDQNKTLVYEFEMEDAVAAGTSFCIQTALLYTNSKGERLIRCFNYMIPLSSEINDIYEYADANALTCAIARPIISKMYIQPLSDLKTQLIQLTKKIIQSSKLYNSKKQIPDSLSLFCLNMIGCMKNQIFNNIYSNNISTDVMNCLRIQYASLPLEELMIHFVPYLFCIDDMKGQQVSYYDEQGYFVYPPTSALNFNSLGKALYLMDVGQFLILYINSSCENKQILTDIFGRDTFNLNEKLDENNLYLNTNQISEQLFNIVQELRNRKSTKYCPLYIVFAQSSDPLELMFYYKLIEDKYEHYISGYNINYSTFVSLMG